MEKPQHRSGTHPHYRRTRPSESTDPETDDDVHGGGHRRLKRSSARASHHSRVLLSAYCARRWDDFPAGNRTPSSAATSLTSKGEEISVSFEFLEPPDTSFLIADLPPAATGPPMIIAAHRDVVLLALTLSYGNKYRPPVRVVDLFVYQASRLPSLLLLPSAGGPEIYHTLGLGIMSSCTSNADDSSPPSFVVSYLEFSEGAATDAHLFRSESGQWEVFKNLQVHGANVDGRESLLRWWKTDAVVRYGRRYMIWVDYYRGMVLMDLSETSTTNPPQPPRLRYVPLPVDRVGNPVDLEFGSSRGLPEASRSVCVTRYGIKFISVDRQHISNFGVGELHTLTWSYRFRITTWSLCEDDYTWENDMTMHEEKFWDSFDGGDRFPFPRVQPQFPVVNVDNPDVVVFRLEETDDDDERVATEPAQWMIEVDLRKKLLLAATDYSVKEGDDAEYINLVRMKSFFSTIRSELPRYLDGGEACKKTRRQ